MLGLGLATAFTAAGLRPRSMPQVGHRPIVALIRTPVRLRVLQPIEAALARLGGERIEVVSLTRAGSAEVPDGRTIIGLEGLAEPRLGIRLLGFEAGVSSRIRSMAETWPDALGSRAAAKALEETARLELARIGLAAAALLSLVARWRPRLLIGFDEVGTWSRILPAVGRRTAVATLNLPHAEAADPAALRGIDYDVVAVFGPVAAAAMASAGIDPGRIVEVGAPHFDALVRRPFGPESAFGPAGLPAPRKILFAAQYVQGAMTRKGLAAGYAVALAAAGAVAPSQFAMVPHPLQERGLIEAIAGETPVPPGVVVSVEVGGLHAALDGAWALMTGWSNSVFEAAIRRVPSILIDPEGVAPVDYAGDGLGLAASDAATAIDAARSLLDESTRTAVLARSAAATERHLGPLDGAAAERAARVIIGLSGSEPGARA